MIPAELRAKFDINIGDRVVWLEDGDRLVLTTRRAQLRRAQAIFSKYQKGPKRSLVDELIRERREEAARE